MWITRSACLVVLAHILLPASAVPLKIACIGDSITQGAGLANPSVEAYPARLQRLLGTNHIVRNYGVSGRTLLKKGDFPYWNESAFRESTNWGPDIVIIQLGTNDSKPYNWRYGTNFVSDYEELVAIYATLPSAPRIIVCTPCPVYGSGAYDISPGVVATNIAPLVRDLATRLGLSLVDLHVRLAGHSEWFPDTVHPNSKGMTAMAAVMYGALFVEPPAGLTPPIDLLRPLPTQLVLSWPARWGGLIPQSTTALRGSNTAWTVVELPTPYGDGTVIHQTNSSASGMARFYRLWQP